MPPLLGPAIPPPRLAAGRCGAKVTLCGEYPAFPKAGRAVAKPLGPLGATGGWYIWFWKLPLNEPDIIFAVGTVTLLLRG